MYPKFKINTFIIFVLFKRSQHVNFKKLKYFIQRIYLMDFIEYFKLNSILMIKFLTLSEIIFTNISKNVTLG